MQSQPVLFQNMASHFGGFSIQPQVSIAIIPKLQPCPHARQNSCTPVKDYKQEITIKKQERLGPATNRTNNQSIENPRSGKGGGLQTDPISFLRGYETFRQNNLAAKEGARRRQPRKSSNCVQSQANKREFLPQLIIDLKKAAVELQKPPISDWTNQGEFIKPYKRFPPIPNDLFEIDNVKMKESRQDRGSFKMVPQFILNRQQKKKEEKELKESKHERRQNNYHPETKSTIPTLPSGQKMDFFSEEDESGKKARTEGRLDFKPAVGNTLDLDEIVARDLQDCFGSSDSSSSHFQELKEELDNLF